MSASTPISYIELAANDLSLIKEFYSKAFNWEFEDYGPEYIAFSNAGVAGGFYYAQLNADANKGSALIVLHSEDLQGCLEKVVAYGGSIKTDIFDFPGGKRFHFLDPCNNELAVWSSE